MWDGRRVDGCGDRQTDWRTSQAVLVEQNPAAVTMTDTQFERGGRGDTVELSREGGGMVSVTKWEMKVTMIAGGGRVQAYKLKLNLSR